jgi:hypothetical protein
MSQKPLVSISVVSHMQGALLPNLLADIAAQCDTAVEVIVTLNMPEDLQFDPGAYPFPIRIVENDIRKGFGANHNAAFHLAYGEHFCVLNPDVRFASNPLPALIEALADHSVGVVAPLIVNPSGEIEDSARRFPTPFSILLKFVSGNRGAEYPVGSTLMFPDWIAGMFMLFRAEVYRQCEGFDEGYFLYYEDVDLCWRLSRSGMQRVLAPAVRVMHDARRTSHRNLRYMVWHLRSMLRFFLKRALG